LGRREEPLMAAVREGWISHPERMLGWFCTRMDANRSDKKFSGLSDKRRSAAERPAYIETIDPDICNIEIEGPEGIGSEKKGSWEVILMECIGKNRVKIYPRKLFLPSRFCTPG
jgi:hypothetical protein